MDYSKIKKTQLIEEIEALQERIVELEHADTERRRAAEEIWGLARFPSENTNPVLRVAKDGTVLYANKASFPLLNVWGCQEGQPSPGGRAGGQDRPQFIEELTTAERAEKLRDAGLS